MATAVTDRREGEREREEEKNHVTKTLQTLCDIKTMANEAHKTVK